MAAARLRLRGDRSTLRLAVAVVALALAAVNYESNSSWLIASLITGLAAVSIIHARRNIRSVTALAETAPAVFAGDPISIPVTVACTAGESLSLDVAIGSGHGACPWIRVGQDQTVVVNHPPLPRGLHRLPLVEVRSRWPFGLVEARRPGVGEVEILVYPKPLGHRLHIQDLAHDGGGEQAGTVEGDDFVGHRRWHVGDSQHRIDWRALARGRPLLVKHFSGSAAECWLDWLAAGSETEARLSQLTRWVLDAEAHGWRYGLRLPGSEIHPGHGSAHQARCLKALAVSPRNHG